ncbi:MAG TPA: acyloxyacyl hydrolase [Dissulfurispiraceae bacterium]
MKKGANLLVVSSLLLVLSLFPPVKGLCAEKDNFFELGIGPGTSLNGIHTEQLLFAPAFSVKIKGTELVRFRLEGNLELIKEHSRLTVVGGIAPLFRFTVPGWKLRPFLEAGGGANLANHNDVGGRRLGGHFFFSAMGGTGVAFSAAGHPASISYRVRHLSNGHLYQWNQSLNSHYLMLSVGF